MLNHLVSREARLALKINNSNTAGELWAYSGRVIQDVYNGVSVWGLGFADPLVCIGDHATDVWWCLGYLV